MRLTLDLDDGTGASRPLVIDADDSASVGDVAKEIAAGLRIHDMETASLAVRSRPAQALLTDTPAAIADIRTGDRVELINGRRGGGDAVVGAATIVIESGPQVGRRIEIGPGRHLVGRGGRSTIVIDDDQLSRTHFSIQVSDVVEIADEGSTNGVKVNDSVIGSPVVLRAGQKVMAGATEFRIEQQVGSLATAPKGTVPFNRPPRVWKPFEGTEITLPTPVGPKPKQRIPKAAAVFPLIMGGAMYAITGNVQTILFMMLSPLMMFGNVYENRRGGAKDHAGDVALFHTELADTEARLRKLAAEEMASREHEAPGVGGLEPLVEQGAAGLWERSPHDADFLDLRLGVGELPLRTKVTFSPPHKAMPNLVAECQRVADEYAQLRSAPVVAKLATCGSLGLAGSQLETESVARSILLQLAVLHSPADLVFAALFGKHMQQRWEWLMWLPHVRSAASPITVNHLPPDLDEAYALLEAVAQLVEKRRALEGSAVQQPSILLIIDESVPLDRSRLNWLFEVPARLGVFVVWLGSSVARMPKECGVVADIPGGGKSGSVGWTQGGDRIDPVRFEGVPAEHAIRVARLLAPIIDVTAGASGGSTLPGAVSLIDLLGNRELLRDPNPMLELWRASKTLGAPVGKTGSATLSLDMRLDGPHALVAGTTGAGKSEFLQAYIASLAANHSPARVTFLLVDYKGGSAFAKCVEFPHTVGLVTDLDTNQVRRALVSLNAELHYREKVLEKHRCKDLIELEKRVPDEAPPSLLLIVDEFAALAKEIPEFVDGVVNVAQRGRSLGIHLILATQRPAGVITDNIRANTNLRIALRVADPSESIDVLGTPIAASLSRTTPGRGIAKVGPQELTPFQTGYVGGHSALDKVEASVTIADVGFGIMKPWPKREQEKAFGPNDPTDLARLVDVANQALKLDGQDMPRRPWLAPLEPAVNLFTLPRSPGDDQIVIGLQDDPSHQRQQPGVWFPEKDGSLAIFGGGGAGKTTALWALAAGISSAVSDPPPTIYGLDFAGRSLEVISELPNVGAVIASDDHERITRLLTMLRSSVQARSAEFAAVKAGDLSSFRRLSPEKASAYPRMFVLIDGYGAFVSAYEKIERGVWADMVPKLIADGRQVGIHFVLTADRRASISSATYSLIPQRIVLRLSNDDEYSSVGAPYKVLNNNSPEGRAIFNGLEMQIAVAGGFRRSDEQAAALRKLGAQLRRQRPGYKARAIEVLPTEISRSSLAASSSAAFAMSSATLQPLTFSLDEGVFLVAGPMRSGKTSTIETLVQTLHEANSARPMFYFSGRRGGLANRSFWTASVTNVEEAAKAIRQLASDIVNFDLPVAPVVVMDDFHEIFETDVGKAVTELLKAGREASIAIIASAESVTARRASTYSTLGEIKQFKQGILLAPDVASSDGDILGVSLPATTIKVWPQGRGYFVRRATAELIQVGMP